MSAQSTDHEPFPAHCLKCGVKLTRNHSWADEVAYCHNCENIGQLENQEDQVDE